MSEKIVNIRPQKGYQLDALTSRADILIGGGAAGVGKTFSLLMEPIRHAHNKNFGSVIFRRTNPMIKAEGGLWDASMKLYQPIPGSYPTKSNLQWEFSTGSKLKFSHLEYEKNVYDWQGSEIPFIGFDELTHFSRNMFFYLLSRNRSTSGVRPYLRATTNPDPDSWVATLVDWWIGEDGFPINERSGKLRYFIVDQDQYVWGSSRREVIEKGWHVLKPLVEKSGLQPGIFVKSLTFIGGSIYDNKALLETNPQYLGNLNAQSEDEKRRLLHGNWKVKISEEDIYHYDRFKDIFTNSFLLDLSRGEERYISADIALKGSDKFVVFVWEGRVLIDFEILAYSKGDTVVNTIANMASRHRVPYSNVTFDNDGVGGFIDGFIDGSREFSNGSRALNNENYANLKTQCFYKSGDSVKNAHYYIPPEIANRPYDERMTLKERLMYERRAIKRAKKDHDGKLQINKKHEQKVLLNGQSPDVIETFMMREIFDLLPYEPEVSYS